MARGSFRHQHGRLVRLLYWVVFDAHIETLELWTALNAFIWGAWLLNPWMTVFNQVNIYSMMSRIPESIWGMTAMTAATLQIWGRLNSHPRMIRYGARTIAGLWMFGAAAIAWQNWRWASIITYPMMASASLFVSFRAVNYSSSQQQAAKEEWEADYGGSS